MADLPQVFRAQDHDSMDDFSPVPKGKYMAQIVKSEIVPTKAAKKCHENGDTTSDVAQAKRCNMQEKILEGEFAGRLVFIGLNMCNPNPTANEISDKELTSICEACGKPEIRNTEELHMIPHMIDVDVIPADANWPEKNVIRKYEALEGSAAAKGLDANPFDDDEDEGKPEGDAKDDDFDDDIPF